jgi:hypothetical protein
MTFEIGHLTLPSASAAPVEAAVAVDVIPASPPPEVLAEVDAAWERGAQLASADRELHFRRDEQSGRMIIEVRTLDGDVLGNIPPSRLLDVMGGGRR